MATVPREWNCGTACHRVSAHGAFSLLVFLCIAYGCIFRASLRSRLFFIEAACIYVCAAYWIVKSREIARTDPDKLAMEGKLTMVYRPRDMFRKISLKRAS